MVTPPASIGSNHLNGFSKLIEEAGELVQVLGKLLATGGSGEHWDGAGDLWQRFEEEAGDVMAGINYVVTHQSPDLSPARINERARSKYNTFMRWNEEQS